MTLPASLRRPAAPTRLLGLAAAALVALSVGGCASGAGKGPEEGLYVKRVNGWAALGKKARVEALGLAKEWRDFVHATPTLRQTIAELRGAAERAGFKALPEAVDVRPGGRFLWGERGKVLMLVVMGKKAPYLGMDVYVVPVDTPRLDLKPNPVRREESFVVLETHAYGVFDRKQWLSVPLALVGYVAGTDGAPGRTLSVGRAPGEPVLVIPDLLPHLSRKAQAEEIVSLEGLDAIASTTLPGADLAKWMEGLDPHAFIHGEWSLVPADPPTLLGVDGGLVGGYGQGLKPLARAWLWALEEGTPERTTVLLAVDKGFGGHTGNTGLSVLPRALGRLVASAAGGVVRESDLGLALARSRAFVAERNGGEVGKGVVLNQRFDDSPPALLRGVVDALDEGKVAFQWSERADWPSQARRLATLNMLAMGLFVPVAGTETPLEVVSAADLLSARRAVRALAGLRTDR